MFQNSNLFISWKYYEATTPEQLEIKLLQLQVNSNSPLTTTHPTFAKGKWTVWVLHDYSQDIRPQDKLLMKGKK